MVCGRTSITMAKTYSDDFAAGFSKPMPRGRNASAVSPALPCQCELHGENSWSAAAHGADGAGAESSGTQAEIHRDDARAVAPLAAAATGFHPGRVAGGIGAQKQLRASVPLLWMVLGKVGLRWKKIAAR